MKVDALDYWCLSRETNWPIERCKLESEKGILQGIDYVSVIKRGARKDLFIYFYSRIKFKFKIYKL